MNSSRRANTRPQIHTQGSATVSLAFHSWKVVPGDPLDKSIKVPRLEAATGQALARDFVVKTRRRKGLADDITVSKFLEPDLYKTLKDSRVLDL